MRHKELIFIQAFILFLAAAIHLALLIPSDFPIQDGGMFYTMTQELQAFDYRLPLYSDYNHLHIPYAYPPLGFYIAGLLSDEFGTPLLHVFQYLPLAVTLLTIPAFSLLAYRVLGSEGPTAFAIAAYGLMPAAFTVTIMGGGITRSFGLLFAILTLVQAHRMFTRGQLRDVLLTAVLGSLVVLSHPIAAWGTAYTALLMLILYARTRRGLLQALAAGGLVLLFTAPWWGSVLARHGLEPFLQAAGTGGQGGLTWLLLVFFDFSEEPFLTLIGAFAFIGLFASLTRKPRFLALWLILNPLIQPRGLSSFAILPLAMLFGVGMYTVILPGLRALPGLGANPVSPGDQDTQESGNWLEETLGFPLGKIFNAFVLWQMVASAFFGAVQIQSLTLSQADRQAMSWIAGSTPADSRFLVISDPLENCPLCDPVLEWFPTLAERTSLNTVQGKEWLQEGDWQELLDSNTHLQSCLDQSADCVEAWAQENQVSFTHVFVRKKANSSSASAEPARAALDESLWNALDYTPVFENNGVTVYSAQP